MNIRLEFHPTGEGYVLCRRFKGNQEGPSIKYREGDTIGLLEPLQQREADLAFEMEFGEGIKPHRF